MLTNNSENYRRALLFGIILIALGIVFNTTLASSAGSLGTVLIAVGGLFFIIGMARKRKTEEG